MSVCVEDGGCEYCEKVEIVIRARGVVVRVVGDGEDVRGEIVGEYVECV